MTLIEYTVCMVLGLAIALIARQVDQRLDQLKTSSGKGWFDHLVQWYDQNRNVSECDVKAQGSIYALDNADDIPDQVADRVKSRFQISKTMRRRYASKLAAECRIALPGITKRTEANRLVAQAFITRALHKDVRMSHKEAIVMMAVEFVFIPTDVAIEMKKFVNSAAVIDRQEEYDATYYSRGTPTWWNWLGPIRRGKAFSPK